MADVRDPAQWEDIDVCTMGMFIIDEIHFNIKTPLGNDYGRNAGTSEVETRVRATTNNDATEGTTSSSETKVLHNIMGGAGSYTALGARMFLTRSRAKRMGWIVDCGSDFPSTMRSQIETWATSCLFRETPERLTTRGWNAYGDGSSEQRAFRYMTPKLRLDESSLTPELLLSRGFHMICSPQRCVSMVEGVLKRRNQLLAGMMELGGDVRDHWRDRPVFVWEPVPDVCSAEEWENCKRALSVVDCISPNHVELAAFFGLEQEIEESEGGVKHASVEDLARKLLSAGIRPDGKGTVVVRAGKEGCCVVAPNLDRPAWLPAYHQVGSGKVVDPTGGGNTFLGGLAAALVNGCSVEVAAAIGSVVAGAAIEQIGMPELDVKADKWNGLKFEERCKVYEERMRKSGSGTQIDMLALQSI